MGLRRPGRRDGRPDLLHLGSRAAVDLDRALARAVAEHKSIFFAESTPDGAPIDYRAAVTGTLTLAPAGGAREALAEDYRHMVEDGLLLEDAEPFEALLQRCQTLADKVNVAVRAGT